MKHLTDIETTALSLTNEAFYRGARARSSRVLITNEAVFSYPDFDPCRAVQNIICVTVPAIINMRETLYTKYFSEKDLNST